MPSPSRSTLPCARATIDYPIWTVARTRKLLRNNSDARAFSCVHRSLYGAKFGGSRGHMGLRTRRCQKLRTLTLRTALASVSIAIIMGRRMLDGRMEGWHHHVLMSVCRPCEMLQVLQEQAIPQVPLLPWCARCQDPHL